MNVARPGGRYGRGRQILLLLAALAIAVAAMGLRQLWGAARATLERHQRLSGQVFRQSRSAARFASDSLRLSTGFDQEMAPFENEIHAMASPFEWKDPNFQDIERRLCTSIERARGLHRQGLDVRAMEQLRVVLTAVSELDLDAGHPGSLVDLEGDSHEAMLAILTSPHTLGVADLRTYGEFLGRFEAARINPLAAVRRVLDEAVQEAGTSGVADLFPGDFSAAAAAVRADRIWKVVLVLSEPVEGRPLRMAAQGMEDDLWKQVQAIYRADGLRRTLMRATRLACALRAFAAAKGRFPDSLEALVPEFYSGTLLDPYGGHPYAGRVDQGAFYSRGFDGVDDHGSPLPPLERPRLALRVTEELGDLVMRVGRQTP